MAEPPDAISWQPMDPHTALRTPLPATDQALPLRARKRTKILATLGPACDDPVIVRAMLEAGVNAVRLNMSHGTRDDQLRRLRTVRMLSKEMDRPVAVLADLQGPKIRTGRLKGGEPVELVPGNTLIITTDVCPEGDVHRVGTTYPGLSKDQKPGDTVMIDDGKMRLRVESVEGHEITLRIEVGGLLKNSKGLNLPGANVSAPALSDKDREDLSWAIENGVDFIALSFVRTARDVRHVKSRIAEAGRSVPVIAKIERPDAVSNIDGILAESDGIMVARGDLGIEISIERLPIVQKELILRANRLGKLVITATQRLESMIEGEMPSRAEATDIANAVFDGTGVVMLSGETATGKHPVQAVAAMSSILLEAEKSRYLPTFEPDPEAQTFSREVMSLSGAAHRISVETGAEAILISSVTPEPALLLSKRRGRVPMVCICTDERMWHALCLYWGIAAVLVEPATDLQALLGKRHRFGDRPRLRPRWPEGRGAVALRRPRGRRHQAAADLNLPGLEAGGWSFQIQEHAEVPTITQLVMALFVRPKPCLVRASSLQPPAGAPESGRGGRLPAVVARFPQIVGFPVLHRAPGHVRRADVHGGQAQALIDHHRSLGVEAETAGRQAQSLDVEVAILVGAVDEGGARRLAIVGADEGAAHQQLELVLLVGVHVLPRRGRIDDLPRDRIALATRVVAHAHLELGRELVLGKAAGGGDGAQIHLGPAEHRQEHRQGEPQADQTGYHHRDEGDEGDVLVGSSWHVGERSRCHPTWEELIGRISSTAGR